MGCLQSMPQEKKRPSAPPSSTGAAIGASDAPEPPKSHPRTQTVPVVTAPQTPRVSTVPERTPARPKRHTRQSKNTKPLEKCLPESPPLGYRMDPIRTSRRDGRYYKHAPFEGDELPEHIPGHRPRSARSISAASPDSSRDDLGSSPLVFDDPPPAHYPPARLASSGRANAGDLAPSDLSRAADASGYGRGKFRTRLTAEPEDLTQNEDVCDDTSSIGTNESLVDLRYGRIDRYDDSRAGRRAERALTERRESRNKSKDPIATAPSRSRTAPSYLRSTPTNAAQSGKLHRSDTTKAVVSFPVRSRRAMQHDSDAGAS